MTVDIGDVLREGFERTVTRNGVVFATLFFVLSVPYAAFSASVNRQFEAGSPQTGAAPAFGLPVGVLAILGLVFGLASLVLTVGAIRTFVSEERETIHAEFFTRNILWVVANLVVGGIVFGFAVGIGFVLLIVPGLFLLVSLFFWNYRVIVEDENFVDGFATSWELTGGNRLTLFALGVVVVLVALVANVVSGIPAVLLPGPVGVLVGQAGSAVVQVFTLATASRAYVQLTGADGEPSSTTAHRGHAVE